MKSPLFCLFWTLFGQFLGTFPIRPVSMIPWLLNWIIFWIESAEFLLNWIIFWIESWVMQYWIEYWIKLFFGKIQTLNWIRLGIAHPYTWAIYKTQNYHWMVQSLRILWFHFHIWPYMVSRVDLVVDDGINGNCHWIPALIFSTTMARCIFMLFFLWFLPLFCSGFITTARACFLKDLKAI